MASTSLITGAAGAGKTQSAIDRIAQAIRYDPFAPVWVVLPNARQVASFQTRLLNTLSAGASVGIGQTAVFNVSCLSFYQLYARLLTLTGIPQREVRDVTQRRLLRTVIHQLADEQALRHYDQIAQTPGFVQQMAELIRELKQARITPEDFSTAARPNDPQDWDLWRIYDRYQATLREGDLVDTEGEGWLALARLAEHDADWQLPAQLLIVDGFDQFNRVQSELLGLLTRHIPQVVITLTYETARAETAHRRFAQTYRRLSQFVEWQVEPLQTRLDNPRPSRLTELSARLFEPAVIHDSASRQIGNEPDTRRSVDTLMLIEAADPRREVETALRLIKRLLIEGAAPESIAVVARDLSLYRALLLDRAAAYGIPVAGDVGTRLIDNPAMMALFSAIDLAAHSFPRRAVVDVLRNPYLTFPMLSAAQVDTLDRLSRQQIVIASAYQWLTAIRDYVPLQPDDSDDDETTPIPDSTFDREGLSESLAAFFARITPPESATASEYAAWLEHLIGADPSAEAVLDDAAMDVLDGNPPESGAAVDPGLNLITNIRHWDGDPTLAARDLTALATFKMALSDLLAAYELLGETAAIAWAIFRSDLGSLADSTKTQGDGLPTTGQVLIGTVFGVRGLPLETLIVLGLSEGQFPAPDPAPVLYLDVERQAINRHLEPFGVSMNTHAERADESGLFYEMTALAHQRLILMRPYSAPDGTAWPPSIYWTAVQTAVNIAPVHLPMNEIVSIEEASSWAEAFMATSHQLNQPSAAELTTPLGVRSWFLTDPVHAPLLAHIERSRRVMLARLRGERNEYSGYLQSDLALGTVGDRLAPEHRWSAAQFNDYGACPYGFFAKRLLGISPLEEPEPGLNAQIRGTLLHHILESTYRQIAREQLTIQPENRARALEILDAHAEAIYSEAPKRYGFGPDSLWKQAQADLTAELQQLVRHDFSDHSQASKLLGGVRSPIAEESAFQDALLIGNAGTIIIGGRIDRIDRSADGLLVIDYKSGSTPFSESDIRDGRAAQTLIYLHVVDQRNPENEQPIHSTYWHTANRKTSGVLHSDQDAELIEQATEALHDRVIAMRAGVFPGQPSKPIDGKCTAYCAFSGLCRVRSR